MTKTITFNCDWCGDEHIQIVWNYNRRETHFCSKGCASSYMHNQKRKERGINLNELVKCACGCGQLRKRWGTGLSELKYISGHCNPENEGRFKKGHVPKNKGRPVPEEQKERQRETLKQTLKETPLTMESRIKISCGSRGIAVEDFDGFVMDSDPRKNSEESRLHSEWRRQIFERDNYSCQLCGIKSGNGHRVILNAHHIKHWKDYPEVRRELENGITLCRECHCYVHSKGYRQELEGDE